MRVVILGSHPDYLINLRGNLIADFVRGGHEVIGMSPGDPEGWQARAIRALGARFEPIDMARQSITPALDLATYRALVRRFRELRPDLVFSYTIKPVIYGSLAARKAGVPGRSALIPGLGQMFTSPGASGALKRAIAGALYRKALGAVDCVFVQNEDDEEFLRRIGAVTRQHHVTRIDGSGVDIERFDPPPLPSDPAFLFVARLVEEKGVAEFVEVARRVRAKVPEATFRVVGYFDGEGESRLRPLLDSAARDRAIEFVGRVEDIRPQIARSSVFVLPSRYREGIPRSALECLAMGRAIITTDWVGCRETVRRGERANGILVPIRDVDALERAALALATDPAMVARMGQESRRYAEERFDVRRVNKAIFEALGIAFPPLVEGARSAMAAL